jgi:short-subunit dehydrogenase
MKKIFLTGASSGIGKATAELLVRRGDEVWGTSRSASRVPSLEGLHAVALDLADRNSIEPAFREALAGAGSFDVLINNAGSGFFGAAESLDRAALEKQFQTLVFGHIELCHLALAGMRATGHGLIINVTSLASQLPIPFMASYNAAKAAMAAYTMSLQLELAASRIRVIDLQPGDIRTGFNDAVLAGERNDRRIERAWQVTDSNMKKAPGADLVAEKIARLIETDDPAPRVVVGDAFQAKVAPLLNRLLPQRTRLWGLRRYYKI